MTQFDLIIIGGGAAGLVAAIQAKQLVPHISVAILEKADRPGKKLLATGGGRCNIANRAADNIEHFYTAKGNHPSFARPALKRFSVSDNLQFFADLGLLTKEEEQGKFYPLGDQAAAVLDTLRLFVAALNIQLVCGAEVTKIAAKNQGFTLLAQGKTYHARSVILALGGNASPKLSNAGDFATLLNPLGLATTELYPALTQLKIADPLPKALQGIKFIGKATVNHDDKSYTELGEILFTAYGLSGPPILQLSRLAENLLGKKSPDTAIHLDILPTYTLDEILAELKRRRDLPLKLEDYLTGMLNKRLGQQLIKRATAKSLGNSAQSLTPDDLASLADLIKDLPLKISGTTGWQNAQVMAGGLSLKCFDPQTLAAKATPGLFACGEILDIIGDCGGYNLSWAWSSARLCATSAVNYLK